MIISKIELFYVEIPLSQRKPHFFKQPNYFLPSWIPGFRQAEMRFYLLKLTTDNNLEGYAAMPAMGPERASLGPLLGNYLMGINPLDINLVNQRIQEFSYIGMRNGWIDAAFWDIIGKHEKKSLWQLFNGFGGNVKPYASTGANNNHDPSKVIEEVKKFQSQGYNGIKLRVKSTDINEMTDYLAAARNEAGPDLAIMVDANQGWPVDIIDKTPKWDVDFALKFAQALEPLNIAWLEEPLNRGNFEGLTHIRKNTSTPIAGGEMNSSWRDFKEMLRLESLDIYQPDAVLVGGTYMGGISLIYHLLQEIKNKNESSGIGAGKVKFCPHTWTTGLGFAVALQLIGVLPPEERKLIEYPYEGHWAPECWNRFIKNNIVPDKEGKIKIPDTPGLGIEIDWNVIRRFGKRVYKGTKKTVAINALKDRGLKMALYLKDKKAEQEHWSSPEEFRLPDLFM